MKDLYTQTGENCGEISVTKGVDDDQRKLYTVTLTDGFDGDLHVTVGYKHNLAEAIHSIYSYISSSDTDNYTVNASGRFKLDYREYDDGLQIIVDFGDPQFYGRIFVV